jgi:hypothetical protein
MRDDAAQVLRWGNAEQDVGLKDGCRKIAGYGDIERQGKAGEIGQIFAALGELLGECG